MSYLPPGELEPDKGGRKPPSTNRVALWIIVSGIGVYLLGSGVWGLLTR